MELSCCWWVCHLAYANVLQAYNETQGPLEVRSSGILDLVGSNEFMLYPKGLYHSFTGCAQLYSLSFNLETGKPVTKIHHSP